MAVERTIENWEQAATDPTTIRAYDGDGGRYLLASDTEAWLRNLALVARDATSVSAVMHAPLLDRLADTIGNMGDQHTPLGDGPINEESRAERGRPGAGPVSAHDLHCDCRIELLAVAEERDEGKRREDQLLADLRKGDLDREKQRIAHAERYAEIERLRGALLHIADSRDCENFTRPPWCRDPGSGRDRDARYGADRWCDTCIALDALEAPSR